MWLMQLTSLRVILAPGVGGSRSSSAVIENPSLSPFIASLPSGLVFDKISHLECPIPNLN